MQIMGIEQEDITILSPPGPPFSLPSPPLLKSNFVCARSRLVTSVSDYTTIESFF